MRGHGCGERGQYGWGGEELQRAGRELSHGKLVLIKLLTSQEAGDRGPMRKCWLEAIVNWGAALSFSRQALKVGQVWRILEMWPGVVRNDVSVSFKTF